MDEDIRLLELARSSLGNLIKEGAHYARDKNDPQISRFLRPIISIHLAIVQPQPDYPSPLSSTDIVELLRLVERAFKYAPDSNHDDTEFPILQKLRQPGRFDENVGQSMTNFLAQKRKRRRIISELKEFATRHFSLANLILKGHESHAPRELKSAPNEPLGQTHTALCSSLNRYIYCECDCSKSKVLPGRSKISRWLQLGYDLPEINCETDDRMETIFDTVFAHVPVKNRGNHWQHLRIKVPWTSKSEETVIGSADTARVESFAVSTDGRPPKLEQYLQRSDFCELLLQNIGPGKRLLRAVSGQLLNLDEFADPDRLLCIGHNRTLSEALQDEGSILSDSGKILLAFVISRSIWKYYDTDLFCAPWIGDQIHFIPEREVVSEDKENKYDPLSPFVSLLVEEGFQSEISERSASCCHQYPRILALAIVLVSIFWRPIPAQAHLHTGLLACSQMIVKQITLDTDSESVYCWIKAIVKSCLDHKAIPGSLYSRRDRQNWLFHNVVTPLQNLVGKDMFNREDACWKPKPLNQQNVQSKTRMRGIHAEEITLLNDDTGTEETVSVAVAQDATRWMYSLTPLHGLLPLEVSPNPVKIAILDTGLSFNQDIAELYYDRYESYCFMQDMNDPVPCNEDLDGHGTHMASIVLKVAPNCKVYASRICLAQKDARDGNSSVAIAERISKAIIYTIDHWEVDIISLSFGFRHVSPEIEKAVKYAYDKNVLVFAAAGNSGNLEEPRYPAKDPHVLCIRAATGFGNSYHANPTNTVGDPGFALLGVGVEGWPSANKTSGGNAKSVKVRRSGTSQATAVGAGVAALILQLMIDCKREALRALSPYTYRAGLLALRNLHGMRKVFANMCDQNPRTFHRIVEPWRLVHGQGSILEDSRKSDFCKTIVKFLDIPPETKKRKYDQRAVVDLR